MLERRTALTVEDFRRLPDDGHRHEIIDGMLVKEPPPAPFHQGVTANLLVSFRTFIEPRGLGLVLPAPVGVVLSPTDVLEPDLIYLTPERLNRVLDDYVAGAPDLVVEVLSPSTASRDRGAKAALYARHGVREYWVVDPASRTVEVYRPDPRGDPQRVATCREGDVLRPAVPAGLEIPVAAVFAWPKGVGGQPSGMAGGPRV